MSRAVASLAWAMTVVSMPAVAQRAAENAVASASDAFGGAVGTETTGIYSDTDVRGFNPQKAGNARLEGVYFDQVAALSGRVKQSNTIRVGFAALDYPFPAPTGIVDYRLRTAGNESILSTNMSLTAYGGTILEADFQQPLIKDHLSIVAGIGYGQIQYPDGAQLENFAWGVRPRIRFNDIEVQPFYSHFKTRNADVRPIIRASGPYLPALIAGDAYLGQPWAQSESNNINYGMSVRARLSDHFTLRGGAFRSRIEKARNFTEIFNVIDPNGLSDHVLFADPEQNVTSDSWETTLTWDSGESDLRNVVWLGARGRSRTTETGGSDIRNFGQVMLGARDIEALPAFVFSPVSVGEVEQTHYMLGYLVRKRGLGQINFGAQRAAYDANFRSSAGRTSSSADPW
ncbi:MAG: hypothetical protein ABW199_02410, partial [Caulobacterales bacterium]